MGAIELPNESGAILGTLFLRDLERSPRPSNSMIDADEAKRIVATRGRHLTERYWGAYVAFLVRSESEHSVLRDCSARIPCYMIRCGTVTVITSDIEHLAGSLTSSFSLNSRYLAGFMYEAEFANRETALNEITEILAGECLEFSLAGVVRRAAWDPRAICRESAEENFEHAAHQVKQVTQRCVDHWASRYDRVVLQLSGGLDSSTVLGCLMRSAYRPEVTCLHFKSGGRDDEDFRYATLAASAANVELVIQPGYTESTRYDERVLRLPRMPKPSVPALALTMDPETRNRVPRQANAEALWDGQGGDHLFFQGGSVFGAVDYAYSHGINGDFLHCVRDAVRQSRQSYWNVLSKSIRLGSLRSRWEPEDEYRRNPAFLNPDLVPNNIGAYLWQPWGDDMASIPPGKRWQIGLFAFLLHRHRPIPELQFAAPLHPLFSQPLMELCLRIPIYTLLRGGIDRALERAAFRDCVPAAIIQRENKGTVAIAVLEKIRECMPYLRDLVLDGVLVRQRVVDPVRLAPYLLGRRPLTSPLIWPFFACIAAEVWARKWEASGWRL
jgi:asparagine synthase (glutamine-hydrolysing)